MKKIITVLIICTFVLCLGFADTKTGKEIKKDTFLIDSTIYSKGQVLRGNDPGIGSVKIDDIVQASSGSPQTTTNVHYASYEAAKYIAVKLFKAIPGVGDVYSRVEDIYNDLSAAGSFFSGMDTRQGIDITTKYSHRGFTHSLYVWNTNRSWKDMGYSLSRYYYKHLYMLVINNKGESISGSYDFNYTNGYQPAAIAKAPHYMNKQWLSNIAYDYWKYNRGRYVETY